jgi:hypothetical protein
MSMEILQRRSARSAWWLVGLATTALALFGCGGSQGSGDSIAGNGGSAGNASGAACSDCGTLLVGLTDAEGDFLSYSVDVLSIALQRPNGASVETLPTTTRIDFAQLTELSDLLSVTTIAAGDFVGGKIRLDYGNAEVFVEKNGEIVRANVVGEDGQPLGVTELDVRLADRDHLVITRGRAAFLAIDFDLAASHDVDTTRSPPVVTARPYIVAEARPVDEKELRVRGTLVGVDTGASSYTVDVRPWHRGDGNLGRVTVHTTATTAFEVDGVATTGAAGLAALAAKPTGTLTVAFGSLDPANREFTAKIVHAGTSVSGEGLDAVHGNVVSRSGDRLTVKGAFAVRRDHRADFRRTVIVEIGPGTKVLKTGSTEALDPTAISVGQSIVALGTLNEPAAADTPPTLDATTGRVRMLVTALHGSVNSVIAGQLNLQLRAIDRLGIEMFDFAGTGVTAASNANPADYEVLTGTLSLAQLAPGESAKVLGFVAPFGSAPPDFSGRTVIDRRDLPATLGIGWGIEGTNAPFLSMGPTGLALDVANADIGERHFLLVGMRRIDLTTLAAGPTLAPADGRTLFGISEPGHVELFASFAEFVTELSVRLGAGDAAVALTAYGSYDAGSNSLNANRISVHFAE